MRRALVLGGTGYVGEAVVRALREAGLPCAFTWHRNEEKARALEGLGATGHQLDLRDATAIRALVGSAASKPLTPALSPRGEGVRSNEAAAPAVRGRRFSAPESRASQAAPASLENAPDVVIHCAAVSRAANLDTLTDADFDDAHAVNVRSAFVVCQALAPRLTAGADVVLLSGLSAGQSAALPAHFASTQGALAALAMALAKELGPRNVRVNVLALGLLEGGLSRDLSPALAQDYRSFSALRRLGTAAEAAKAALWLALENTWMNGRVMTVNGGL